MSVFVLKWHFWWWRQIWRHLHEMVLQSLAKFSNGLIHWSIRMIDAKNYEIVSKFVKVMPKILWPLFFWTRCIFICYRRTARLCHSLSPVCLSVRPSALTFKYRDHVCWNTSKIISRLISSRLMLELTSTSTVWSSTNTPKIRVE